MLARPLGSQGLFLRLPPGTTSPDRAAGTELLCPCPLRPRPATLAPSRAHAQPCPTQPRLQALPRGAARLRLGPQRGKEAATHSQAPRATSPLYANTQPAARVLSAQPGPGGGANGAGRGREGGAGPAGRVGHQGTREARPSRLLSEPSGLNAVRPPSKAGLGPPAPPSSPTVSFPVGVRA